MPNRFLFSISSSCPMHFYPSHPPKNSAHGSPFLIFPHNDPVRVARLRDSDLFKIKQCSELHGRAQIFLVLYCHSNHCSNCSSFRAKGHIAKSSCLLKNDTRTLYHRYNRNFDAFHMYTGCFLFVTELAQRRNISLSLWLFHILKQPH